MKPFVVITEALSAEKWVTVSILTTVAQNSECLPKS